MRHSEIRRACHDAGYAAFLAIAGEDDRRTQQSIEAFDDEAGSFSADLYGYSRERGFPKPEVLWRKAHEFIDMSVDRDWSKIAESERVYFTVFGATAAALEPIHEEDPEEEDAVDDGQVDAKEQGLVPGQAGDAQAQAAAQEPGATGPGEMDQGGSASSGEGEGEGDGANAGTVTEPAVDHSPVSTETASADSLVVPPVDHSAATPEAREAEAEAGDAGNYAEARLADDETAAEPDAAATQDAEPDAVTTKSRRKK